MGRGPYSTAKQQAAMKLRHECGATNAQIAQWLNISERAVRARLQNARRAANPSGTAESVMVDMHRRRTFAASQISSGDRETLDLDAL
jgi:DNA-binding NarL/FixJ family response regulator